MAEKLFYCYLEPSKLQKESSGEIPSQEAETYVDQADGSSGSNLGTDAQATGSSEKENAGWNLAEKNPDLVEFNVVQRGLANFLESVSISHSQRS